MINTLKLIIKGTITTKTAIHVGAQRSLDPIESDNPVLKDIGGRPVIPGSSLKGVFRSLIESTMKGMGVTKVCSPADGELCVDKKKLENLKNNYDEYIKHIMDNSCPVCKLFGSPYLSSKIHFEDATVEEGWKEDFYEIRDGVAIDRDSRTAAPKKKFDFETVPPDVKFNLNITMENPNPYDIGMIAMAIELINIGAVGIGGNRSRGLGRVEIEITEVNIISKDSMKEFINSRGSNPPFKLANWEKLKEEGLSHLKSKIEEWKSLGGKQHV